MTRQSTHFLRCLLSPNMTTMSLVRMTSPPNTKPRPHIKRTHPLITTTCSHDTTSISPCEMRSLTDTRSILCFIKTIVIPFRRALVPYLRPGNIDSPNLGKPRLCLHHLVHNQRYTLTLTTNMLIVLTL